jgi:hypothetical protein
VDRGYSRGVRFLACLALVACSATAPIARPPAPAKPARVVEPFPADAPFRLPHTFEPSRYRVRIALGEKTLSGHVEIDGTITESLPLLWLHGFDIKVTKAVARRDGIEVAMDASAPRADQVLAFRPMTPLEPGTWTIAIEYSDPVDARTVSTTRSRP